MADLRERQAAKEDSNEAARYQIKSMKAEIDVQRSRLNHQNDTIEQRDDELRSVLARLNNCINEQAGIKYELK